MVNQKHRLLRITLEVCNPEKESPRILYEPSTNAEPVFLKGNKRDTVARRSSSITTNYSLFNYAIRSYSVSRASRDRFKDKGNKRDRKGELKVDRGQGLAEYSNATDDQ